MTDYIRLDFVDFVPWLFSYLSECSSLLFVRLFFLNLSLNVSATQNFVFYLLFSAQTLSQLYHPLKGFQLFL